MKISDVIGFAERQAQAFKHFSTTLGKISGLHRPKNLKSLIAKMHRLGKRIERKENDLATLREKRNAVKDELLTKLKKNEAIMKANLASGEILKEFEV